jgi:hypothetical protein
VSEPAFLSAATIAKLRRLDRRGDATTQAVTQPPTVTLRRRDPDTGEMGDVATFTPYDLVIEDRMEQAGGANTGLVTATITATMRVDGDLAIRRDDRFTVDGVTYRVDLPEPVLTVGGRRDVRLTVLGG